MVWRRRNKVRPRRGLLREQPRLIVWRGAAAPGQSTVLRRSYGAVGGERTSRTVCKGDACGVLRRAALCAQARGDVLHMLLRCPGARGWHARTAASGPARKLEPSQTL